MEVVSQSDRHGRINKRQSEECEHEFGIEIISFIKLSKSPRPSKSPRLTVDDIKPHIIGITESWANNDITDAELGLEGYAMFRKDRMGRRGGGVLLYIKDTIPAYEVQLQEEADCNEAIMVQTSYRTYNSYHWSSISLSQHNQTEQRKNT